MKRSDHVDRDHRVPPVLGEVDDLGDVLDAGVVDQDVDAAELPHGRRPRVRGSAPAWTCRPRNRRRATPYFPASSARSFSISPGSPNPFSISAAALGRQRGGDAETDPAGRPGDNRSFTFEHYSPPDIACRGDAGAAVAVSQRRPIAAARQTMRFRQTMRVPNRRSGFRRSPCARRFAFRKTWAICRTPGANCYRHMNCCDEEEFPPRCQGK